jgi:hypothetical protein
MSGLCGQCRKARACRFRQPGTWVVECGLFIQNTTKDKARPLGDWQNWSQQAGDGDQVPRELTNHSNS